MNMDVVDNARKIVEATAAKIPPRGSTSAESGGEKLTRIAAGETPRKVTPIHVPPSVEKTPPVEKFPKVDAFVNMEEAEAIATAELARSTRTHSE